MAKILAIDDNNDNLISLKAIINDAFPDSVLFTSLNGPTGIELAISNDPDVILLDIIMPVMDGFEVCKLLKQDERVSDIPVIFLTSIQGDKKSRIKALEVGAEAFLSKPIDETELMAQIMTMVKIKAANQQKRDEKIRLKRLVDERTQKLELSQIATLNLLDELRTENEVRKKTEDALRKSEEQLRSIFNNLQDAYFQADLSGKFTIISPSAVRMFKYGTVEELIGKDAESLYADPNIRSSLMSELKSSGRIEDFVCQGRKKDGTAFWVSMNIQLRYDETGQILGSEGVIRDITDRKLAEEELKRSFSLLNATLESTADGILVVDRNGKVTNFNKKFAEFWQIPESILLTNDDDALMSFVINQLKDPDSFLKKVRELYSNEDETSFDLLEFKDGRVLERYSQSQRNEGKNVGRVWSFRDITKRKKAELALHENVQLFQGLFNGSPDAIILIDPHDPEISWPIIDCNTVACQMNGFTREELIGSSIDILNEIEGTKEERAAYFDELKKKGTIQKEIFHRHKNGKLIDIEVLSSIVTLGGREMVLGIDRDITERKRVEEALRESEQRYRQLVERSPNGIAIYQEGKFVYVNPAGVAIFGGTDQKDLIGKSVLSIVHPDSMDVVLNRMKLVSTGVAVPALEEKLIRFDGSPFDAEVVALNTTYNDKPAGQVIVWDITNRKQAAEALRESQILYHSFVENMPAGVFRKDSVGRYVFVNTVFCQLKGLTAEEILGKTPNELSEYESAIEIGRPSDARNKRQFLADQANQHHELIMRTGKSIEVEEVFHNQYGSAQYLQVVKSPVFSSNGKIIGSQGVLFDITELKRVEIKLREAKEQAEESDRLKSAFLANMSHEIRTPLNSIIGFSELMSDPDFDFTQQFQFARMINTSGNNLLSIISDIMDISKIEAGQVQIKKRVHSASNLISDIQKEYAFKAIENGIELQLDPSNPKEDVFIESDEDRLRQILINFVGNAIKFTEKGSISIGLKPMGDFIQFHVKDTGIGVPREFQEQIFERFRQVETGNTRKYGGNGLGLPISKSLVELLGGTIWMESEEGKGSTFYIKIPI